MTSLTVVVCNYNKRDYLKHCLDSLKQTDSRHLKMQVLVVDNASGDGSQEMVRQHYSDWVTLVPMTENTGGAGGFSEGMRCALATRSEYIALLDNDILLDCDTLPLLVAYLQHNPAVAVAGAKICTMDAPEILQELGAFIDWERYTVSTPHKGASDDEKLPTSVNCDYVPACCLVTRHDVVDQIGVFDEAHFIYWDDIDWCQRVKRAGYQIHAVRDARVQHKMGAVHTPTTFSNYYFERNRFRFFANYLNEQDYAKFARLRCEEFAPQAFFASRKGKLAQVHSAHYALMDFAGGRWHAQPDAVLHKEQGDMYSVLEDISGLSVQGSDQNLVNRVVSMLPARLRDSTKKSGGSCTQAYACDHILSATAPGEGWLIDQYGNICHTDEHDALISQFSYFQQVYDRIQVPVYMRELMNGYRRYRKEKAIA